MSDSAGLVVEQTVEKLVSVHDESWTSSFVFIWGLIMLECKPHEGMGVALLCSPLCL